MREILLLGIFVAFSLSVQIFFLRVCKERFALERNDLRLKKMIWMIYLNLILYIVLIGVLFCELRKYW